MPRNIKILAAFFLYQMIVASASWSIEVGDPMPDFGLHTFAGKNVTRAALSGKPALIVFWNTWCTNCSRELPLIGQLAKQFSPKGLTVLAINTGMNDSEGKARAYWEKRGYQFPVGFDRTFEIGQAFGIIGVPTVLLVDAKGTVRYKNPSIPDNMDERFKELSRK